MDLRDNISEHRRSAGLTQEDVASKLGVSRQTVGKWETGRALPELEKLIALCDLFGCTLDELVGRTCADLYEASSDDGFTTSTFDILVEQAPCNNPVKETAPDCTGRLAKHACVLATGLWIIIAAMGLLLLLFGPSSIDNIEVRKTVPYAVLIGVCLGAALVVAAAKIGRGRTEDGMLDYPIIRRWRVIAIATAIVIIVIAYTFFALAPDMRAMVFICTEIAALALWPIVFVIDISRNARS